MSAPTASKKKNKTVEPNEDISKFTKFRTAAKGWVPAFIASFGAVFVASAIEFFFPIPLGLSTSLIALPIIATVILVKDSLWKTLARSIGVAILVNVIHPDYALISFVLGSTWVLRRAWVDGNPSGSNYRLIKQHLKIRDSISAKMPLLAKVPGFTKIP